MFYITNLRSLFYVKKSVLLKITRLQLFVNKISQVCDEKNPHSDQIVFYNNYQTSTFFQKGY